MLNLNYKLYEIYSHKFAVYIVAKNKEEIEQIQKYNKKMDLISEINPNDFIIFNDRNSNQMKNYIKVKDYINEHQELHKVGHAFFQWSEFENGTVQIVNNYEVKKGKDIFFWRIGS